MAHLACTRHLKRVMFVEDRIIHRFNGSSCDSKRFKFNGEEFDVADAVNGNFGLEKNAKRAIL